MKNKKRRVRNRGKNEGSIFFDDADGRWRAVVPARLSPTGKRRVIVGSEREGNTREAVASRLAVALAGKPGQTVHPSRDTVETFLKRWIESVATRVRPKTLESYTATANLITSIIGGVKLQALEPHHVVGMMSRLRLSKRAVRTVAYARSILRTALTDAKRWGLVPRNVADREYVDPPSIARGEVQAHDVATVKKILAKVTDPADRVLLTVISSLGLRIGEALGLKWRDVDFDTKTLRIVRALQRQAKPTGLVLVDVKTSRSRRLLQMSPSLAAELKAHRRTQLEAKMKAADVWQENDLIFPARFGTPMDPRNALRVLHRAEVLAKVPRLGLHKLRNSAATILLTEGVPLDVVSDILGHSSIRMTKDVYGAFVLSRQQQAAAVMNGIFAPTKAKPRKKA